MLGDAVNYAIGHYLGPMVFSSDRARLLNRRHLERTHEFYERHGGKTIFLARFVPIIRTFAPFVAGIGRMSYRYFAGYNVTGALAWVLSLPARRLLVRPDSDREAQLPHRDPRDHRDLADAGGDRVPARAAGAGAS